MGATEISPGGVLGGGGLQQRSEELPMGKPWEKYGKLWEKIWENYHCSRLLEVENCENHRELKSSTCKPWQNEANSTRLRDLDCPHSD